MLPSLEQSFRCLSCELLAKRIALQRNHSPYFVISCFLVQLAFSLSDRFLHSFARTFKRSSLSCEWEEQHEIHQYPKIWCPFSSLTLTMPLRAIMSFFFASEKHMNAVRGGMGTVGSFCNGEGAPAVDENLLSVVRKLEGGTFSEERKT